MKNCQITVRAITNGYIVQLTKTNDRGQPDYDRTTGQHKKVEMFAKDEQDVADKVVKALNIKSKKD